MTKIIVQNFADQFALSRKQIEPIINILPDPCFQSINEILLCFDERNKEPFEYSAEKRAVYFSYPVKQKTREDVEKAVEAFLVGLARINADSTFYRPIRQPERREFGNLISPWKARVLEALSR